MSRKWTPRSAISATSSRGTAKAAERAPRLQKVGDGVPVAPHRGDMGCERAALDAPQMAALVIIRERQMRDAAGFPEPHGVAPLRLIARRRDAGIDADGRQIAP